MHESSFSPEFSLSGAVFAPLAAGTIRIGHTVQGAGADLIPVAASQFRVTLPVRDADGTWQAHPIDAKLRSHSGSSRLESIPVRVQFDDPSLVMRSRLEAFHPDTKQLICTSNGAGKAKRRGDGGVADVACDGCGKCDFANGFGVGASICRPLGRLNVGIDGHEGELDNFVLRTSSYHSQRNLESKLNQYRALFGGLRGLSMRLALRPMQTELSNWETFYVLDLQLPQSLHDSFLQVKDQKSIDQESLLFWSSYEMVTRKGLENGGVFGDVEPDAEMDLAEFGFVSASRYKVRQTDISQSDDLPSAPVMSSGKTEAHVGNAFIENLIKTPVTDEKVFPDLGDVDDLVASLVPGSDNKTGSGDSVHGILDFMEMASINAAKAAKADNVVPIDEGHKNRDSKSRTPRPKAITLGDLSSSSIGDLLAQSATSALMSAHDGASQHAQIDFGG